LPRWWGEDEDEEGARKGREEGGAGRDEDERDVRARALAHGLPKPLSESRQRVKPATG
jgi:hypothetical protein